MRRLEVVGVLLLVLSAPATARADDCLGVVVAPPPERPAVLGRVVTVSWTSTPCAEPRSFACALAGGTAAEIADMTIEVRERWGAGGAKTAPDPARLRLVGAQPREPDGCGGEPLREGALRVFVLGEAIDGGYEIAGSYPWVEPAAEPASSAPAPAVVPKGKGCAGCATGGGGAGPSLVVLVALAALVGGRRARRARA